jgi:hypothetical protein
MILHQFRLTPRQASVSSFIQVSRLAQTCCGHSGLYSANRNYTTGNHGPLLSASQLKDVVDSAAPPVILDCTWFMPNVGRDAAAEFQKRRIPGARLFNLDEVTDRSSPYPHMLPSAKDFADALGIFNVLRF